MDFKRFVNDEEFESTKVEFKSIVSRKNYETWAKSVVAFANTSGGAIYFGVDDDENAVGITKEQAKNDLLYINDIIDRKIHPRICFEVEKIKVGEDLFVLAVEVEKNDNIPVWLLRTDEQEVIYVRRDGQSVIARGDQIERLVLASKRAPYDQEFTKIPYEESAYQDLMRLYREAKGPEETISPKQLQSVGAISVEGFVSRGLLLFADEAGARNCNVVCRTWPGLSKGSSVLLDKKTFRGNIPSLLDFARDYIRFYS
ncbi:MAG: helix-turn-helix domain-containing protein, partial [Candidatus Enteromonas sp.]